MIYFRGTKDIHLDHTVVALGKFDGLHRGHQLLINKLKEYGKKGFQTVVFTFDFHPMSLLTGKKQSLIYTKEERLRIVEEMGIDVLIEYPFTQETAHMMPEDFVRDVLVRDIGAKVIVVGDDFHFGYQRSGDVSFLKKHVAAYGYVVDNCEKLCVHGEEISSTMIRGYIAEGRMETVTELLGRPYEINGKVIPGKANGRKVDMRTANLAPDDIKLLPPEGVYASVVQIEGMEGKYYALTNIGRNPTVGDHNELRIETHVVEFSGDLYDRMITVRIYQRLRDEHKFASLEEVKAQVMKDQEKAMAYFKEHHI